MRLLFFLFFSNLFILCSNTKKQEPLIPFDLEGVWILEEYIEPILNDKTIAKYRMLKPSFFGILISIENTKIKLYGSLNSTVIEDNNFINKKENFYFKNRDNSQWTIEYKEREDKIIISEVNDTIKYHYKRLDGFDNLNSENVSLRITEYFNNHILRGTYEIISPKLNKGNIIEFGENSSLEGFDDYNKFIIYNFFGTLHQYGNLDVLFVINEKDESYKAFNWKFENDKLILTEFIEDPQYPKEKYIIGNNKMILKRK